MTVIKHASAADAQTFRALAAACPPLEIHTPYTYWVLARMFPATCLLAVDDGDPIGMALALPSGGDLFLWQLGVLPEARGAGVAAQMLDSLAQVAKQNACRQILTTITPGNDASLLALRALARRLDAPVSRVDEMCAPDPITGVEHPETMYAIRLEF